MYAKTKNEIKKICNYMANHSTEIDVSEPVDCPMCLANFPDSQAPQLDDQEITYGFQVEDGVLLAHFVIEHSSKKKNKMNIWKGAKENAQSDMKFRKNAKLPHKYIPIGVKADALAEELGFIGEDIDFSNAGLSYIGDELQ